MGGGAILDFGSYGIDILQWIFEDDPIYIKATGKLNDDGVDTDVTAVFSYCNNRKATLKLSINEALTNVLKIVGTKRSMQVKCFSEKKCIQSRGDSCQHICTARNDFLFLSMFLVGSQFLVRNQFN